MEKKKAPSERTGKRREANAKREEARAVRDSETKEAIRLERQRRMDHKPRPAPGDAPPPDLDAREWQDAIKRLSDYEKRGVRDAVVVHSMVRFRGTAIVDFGGVIGLDAGLGYVPARSAGPKRGQSKTARARLRMERAAQNALALLTIVQGGRSRGFKIEQIARAQDAIEAAVRHYYMPDPHPRAYVRELIAFLEWGLGRVYAGHRESEVARCLHLHSRFDVGGLARIPQRTWCDALARWQGRSRSTKGKLGRPNALAATYDYRDVVLDLMECIDPGQRNLGSTRGRANARRWIDKCAEAELPIPRA